MPDIPTPVAGGGARMQPPATVAVNVTPPPLAAAGPLTEIDETLKARRAVQVDTRNGGGGLRAHGFRARTAIERLFSALLPGRGVPRLLAPLSLGRARE